MKRILQAVDGVATKPVVGADSMAKFLRVVKEAEINQPDPKYAEYAQLMAKYDMLAKEMAPDASGLGVQKGASPDAIASVNAIKAKAAQLAGPNLQAWEQARQKENADSMTQAQANLPAMAAQLENIESTLSPEQLAYNQLRAQLDGVDAIRGGGDANTFTDISPEVTASTNAMRTKLAQMAAALQAKGIDATAEYDAPDPAVPAAAPVDLAKKYVDENTSMSRLLSIIQKNDVKILNEGRGPHKVALPVQMTMQHYQKTETAPAKKSLGISKYLHKVEEELAEQQAHKRQLINQYASTVAERVLMKEGKAVKQRLDPKCWTGKHKEGTKIKGGVRVNNCVPNESVNEHEAGWERHGQGPGMQNYVVDEAPLDFDKDSPMSSRVYGHKGANSGSIEYRMARARGQLQELAKMAQRDDPLAWQHIARLFPELAMNIEQIDHGLRQLGSIRRKGGRNSKNIPQHLDPDVNKNGQE